ncbi:MAG: hypothetical protein ACK5MT_02740, partial [Actinomycetales bacterium]
MEPSPPRRVRVTGPRSRAIPLKPDWRVEASVESDEMGEVFVDSLMRTQLRLGVVIVVTFAFTGVIMPLL